MNQQQINKLAEESLVELLERRFVTADGVIEWNEQVKGLISKAAGYTAAKEDKAGITLSAKQVLSEIMGESVEYIDRKLESPTTGFVISIPEALQAMEDYIQSLTPSPNQSGRGKIKS